MKNLNNQIKKYLPTSEFKTLHSRILTAGSDNIATFGGVKQGGYKIQQNPNELAALCCFLRYEFPESIYGYFEIGTASGGTCRFIYENIGFNKAIIIDDQRHPAAKEQENNFFGFRSRIELIKENSQSEYVKKFLETGGYTFDAVFIDGNHTFHGVANDIKLINNKYNSNAIYIFHDLVTPGSDVSKAINKSGLEIIESFIDDKKPLGIAVCKMAV